MKLGWLQVVEPVYMLSRKDPRPRGCILDNCCDKDGFRILEQLKPGTSKDLETGSCEMYTDEEY